MRTARQTFRAGFTLIEIMVAIAILALIVTAIYSAWTAILRSTQAGISAAAAAQRERVAMRVMTDALTSARLFTANLRWYYFEAENGDDALLSFVSQLPASFPRGGKFGDLDVRRVTFSLEGGANSQRQLVLRQAPLLMDIDDDEQEHPLVLLPNVKELKFEFWDARRSEWLDEWTATNTIPTTVRITLTVGASSGSARSREPEVTDTISRVASVAAAGVQQTWQMPNVPMGLPGGAPAPASPPILLR